MQRRIIGLVCVCLLAGIHAMAQNLPDDGPLTVRPALQQLGQRLLKGKQGSIVAIKPSTGEIICLATNSPAGSNVNLAIATAYPPADGNIHVGCHQHASPLSLVNALAFSCNTWFLSTFMTMLNDDFVFENKEEAINTWASYMRSMGLGGPLNIDIPGELGGIVANTNYLSRRYKDGWNARTIIWTGMGQGDITATPMQLCNLAATIANRGFFYTPHIHQATAERPLPQRFLRKRSTMVFADAYTPVIEGMRQAVEKGTCTSLKTTYPICGKTGTAENSGADHSAFIGFAPMNDPKIAIAVYIEHGGFGADMAAPIAGLIIESYLKGHLSPASEARAKRLENKRIFQ